MKILTVLALALAVAFAYGGSAQANIVIGDKIKFADGPGTTGGGEFLADVVGKGGAIDFITFCVELSETLGFGPLFTVADISNSAKLGGVGGGGVEDPLNQSTAYLYYHFVKGDLPGGYIHNNADANALQKLIWKIEEAYSYTPAGKYADWYNAALAHEAAGGGLLGVQVLTLKWASGQNAQDVLVVPEPGTLLLLGTGLLAVVAFSRRRG